jgi:hypothetical protein
MILILIFLFGTYPQEGDADDTENNPSNMQEENMAGYVLKVPAIETRKVPITHVLSMDEPLNIPAIETRKTTINNMQEEDMAGYGLKAPAIETRKMPITHVLGMDEPLNVPTIETRKRPTQEDSKSSSSDDSSCD